ncbi:XRE family transcriptional regulator [Rhodopseudomonas sp.]|uniref:XRE family transcriptional regulator n=1 Tax=Rhodopseudomonas sp. TaxID=1078 RepID=UPI0039E35C92
MATGRCRIERVARTEVGRYTTWINTQPSDDDLTIHRSSGNFLADQGIADPDEFKVKSHLCHEISSTTERRGLTPAGLAELAGETEQDIERVLRSRHENSEVWRLIRILTALGADVGIYVIPGSGSDRGVVVSETVGEAERSKST